jgi:hypothetical protein
MLLLLLGEQRQIAIADRDLRPQASKDGVFHPRNYDPIWLYNSEREPIKYTIEAIIEAIRHRRRFGSLVKRLKSGWTVFGEVVVATT